MEFWPQTTTRNVQAEMTFLLLGLILIVLHVLLCAQCFVLLFLFFPRIRYYNTHNMAPKLNLRQKSETPQAPFAHFYHAPKNCTLCVYSGAVCVTFLGKLLN